MKKRFHLSDLDCAHCAAKMEDAIRKIDGVHSASVNFLSQKLSIDADDARFDGIMREVVAVCKKVEPDCVIPPVRPDIRPVGSGAARQEVPHPLRRQVLGARGGNRKALPVRRAFCGGEHPRTLSRLCRNGLEKGRFRIGHLPFLRGTCLLKRDEGFDGVWTAFCRAPAFLRAFIGRLSSGPSFPAVFRRDWRSFKNL